jgi:hypothetical protein
LLGSRYFGIDAGDFAFQGIDFGLFAIGNLGGLLDLSLKGCNLNIELIGPSLVRNNSSYKTKSNSNNS